MSDEYVFRVGYYGMLGIQDPNHPAGLATVITVEPRLATDAELAEAASPLTPGERLSEMLGTRWQGDNVPHLVVRNPSLPWQDLRPVLEGQGPRCIRRIHGLVTDAWRCNPALPVHLMADPRPELLEAAARTLQAEALGSMPGFLGRKPDQASLAALVAILARLEREHAWGFDGQTGLMGLARHLARLFGLPWPDPDASDAG